MVSETSQLWELGSRPRLKVYLHGQIVVALREAVTAFFKYAVATLGWLAWRDIVLQDAGGTNLAVPIKALSINRSALLFFGTLDWTVA